MTNLVTNVFVYVMLSTNYWSEPQGGFKEHNLYWEKPQPINSTNPALGLTVGKRYETNHFAVDEITFLVYPHAGKYEVHVLNSRRLTNWVVVSTDTYLLHRDYYRCWSKH